MSLLGTDPFSDPLVTLQGERRRASPSEDAFGLLKYFLSRDALNLAGLDFLDMPVDFTFPGGFSFGIAGVQVPRSDAPPVRPPFPAASGAFLQRFVPVSAAQFLC